MHPTAERFAHRVRELGLSIEVTELTSSARTAEEAAAALGVQTGQIIKSLVFTRGQEPILLLCAGDRTVDAKRMGLTMATPSVVRDATGFAIGGVPPLGHDKALPTLIDNSLQRFEVAWAAAGTPHYVFSIRTADLIAAIPHAEVVAVS